MLPGRHVAASTVVAGITYSLNHSLAMVAGVFIGGVLVDLDHLPDYWREHGFSINIVHFMEVCNNYGLRQIYLLFHSYELLLVSMVVALFMHSLFMWGLVAGYALHMALDQAGNHAEPMTYFLFYRRSKKFHQASLLEIPEHLKEKRKQYMRERRRR